MLQSLRIRIRIRDSSAGRILEFRGDFGKYRDWRRSVEVNHAGQHDVTRDLTAPRVLAALQGDAYGATRHLSPENLRQEGATELTKLLEFLDTRYAWQPKSLLHEAMEAYLYFAAR